MHLQREGAVAQVVLPVRQLEPAARQLPLRGLDEPRPLGLQPLPLGEVAQRRLQGAAVRQQPQAELLDGGGLPLHADVLGLDPGADLLELGDAADEGVALVAEGAFEARQLLGPGAQARLRRRKVRGELEELGAAGGFEEALLVPDAGLARFEGIKGFFQPSVKVFQRCESAQQLALKRFFFYCF